MRGHYLNLRLTDHIPRKQKRPNVIWIPGDSVTGEVVLQSRL